MGRLGRRGRVGLVLVLAGLAVSVGVYLPPLADSSLGTPTASVFVAFGGYLLAVAGGGLAGYDLGTRSGRPRTVGVVGAVAVGLAFGTVGAGAAGFGPSTTVAAALAVVAALVGSVVVLVGPRLWAPGSGEA